MSRNLSFQFGEAAPDGYGREGLYGRSIPPSTCFRTPSRSLARCGRADPFIGAITTAWPTPFLKRSPYSMSLIISSSFHPGNSPLIYSTLKTLPLYSPRSFWTFKGVSTMSRGTHRFRSTMSQPRAGSSPRGEASF